MTESPSYLLVHPSADLYGSDRVFLETVDAFTRTGGRVTVSLASSGPLVALLEAAGATVLITPTLVLQRRLFTPRGIFSFFRQCARGLRHGNRVMREVRPTLVWGNTITVPLWTLLARLHRVASVVHVHEAEGSSPPLIVRSLSFPLRFTDRLVANSQYTLDVLSRANPALRRRSVIIPNAVSGPDAPIAARGSVADELNVLFVGRLSQRKGVDLVISAVAELARRGIPANLDIVGAVVPDSEWYEDKLRALIADSNLGGRVHLLGFQKSPWEALAASDVLVVPSRLDESFGNTAVEGILAARPIVVSDASGLREAATGFQAAQFVRVDDAEAIADALELISRQWDRFGSAAAADRATAVARHDPAIYRARIVAVARSVMSVRETERVTR